MAILFSPTQKSVNLLISSVFCFHYSRIQGWRHSRGSCEILCAVLFRAARRTNCLKQLCEIKKPLFSLRARAEWRTNCWADCTDSSRFVWFTRFCLSYNNTINVEFCFARMRNKSASIYVTHYYEFIFFMNNNLKLSLFAFLFSINNI